MVLHSRGCGRVARRRFKPPLQTYRASRSSPWLPGGPFFMLSFRASRRASLREPHFLYSSCLFYLPAESHAGSRKALFVYSPFLFPACVPHVDSRLRGWCHSGTGCRRMVLFWGPSGPFTGGRFPPETVDSMVQDVADRRSVSSEYRTGVIRVPM